MSWMLNCSRCGGWVGVNGRDDVVDGEVGYPLCARCCRSGRYGINGHLDWSGFLGWGIAITIEPWMRYNGPGIWSLQPDYDLPFVQQRRQKRKVA